MLSAGFSFSRLLSQTVLKKCKHVSQKMFSNKYLLLTNVAVSVTLSGTGDFLEQALEMSSESSKQWDKKRTSYMATSGLTVGVVCHYWYMFLDSKLPERTIKVVAKKVVVDQLVFSPICISVFFVTLGLLERASVETIRTEIVKKGWRLYVAEWFIWPPAQVINFYWLPTRYRVLYDNTISLGYDIYTSYVVHDNSVE
ncbi:mpv17-like protein 2 [Nilaparvata lugens]|uniref:mpv17-like protein 2 n=1 Tax=Nilaparvata lugens TaxID=108931 RepID=UPI00193EAC40|nr:mpv17-like protein 2 [Nilaparvata lugens]